MCLPPASLATQRLPRRELLQRRHAENKKYDSDREDHRAAVKFKPGGGEEVEEGGIRTTAGAR